MILYCEALQIWGKLVVRRMVKNSQMPAIDFGAIVPLGRLICTCTSDKLEKTIAMSIPGAEPASASTIDTNEEDCETDSSPQKTPIVFHLLALSNLKLLKGIYKYRFQNEWKLTISMSWFISLLLNMILIKRKQENAGGSWDLKNSCMIM